MDTTKLLQLARLLSLITVDEMFDYVSEINNCKGDIALMNKTNESWTENITDKVVESALKSKKKV